VTDPYSRTARGLPERILQRIGSLEHRIARGLSLPNRLVDIGRGTTAERDALFGDVALFTTPEKVALANRRVIWFNIDKDWEESFYAPVGWASQGLVVPGLTGGATSGWYPTGFGPEIVLEPSATANANSGVLIGGWNGVVRERGGADWFTSDTNGVRFLRYGYYDLSWWTLQATGTGAADYHTQIRNSTDATIEWRSNVGGQPLSTIFTSVGAEYSSVFVAATERFRVQCVTGALVVHQVTGGTPRPATRGQMLVRYVRPPVVPIP
jgi:hypothetical protein